LIASISALSMILIPSFAPSASKPHEKAAKREQNPHYTRYNGLKQPFCSRRLWRSPRFSAPLHYSIEGEDAFEVLGRSSSCG
jgi:hypothetical protein